MMFLFAALLSVTAHAENLSMNCFETARPAGAGRNAIYRCENAEVVCYVISETTQDAALSCKFKEQPQPPKKKK